MKIIKSQYIKSNLHINQIVKININMSQIYIPIEDIDIGNIIPNILILFVKSNIKPNYYNIFSSVEILIVNSNGLMNGLWKEIPEHVKYIIVNKKLYFNNKNKFDFIDFENWDKKKEIISELIEQNKINDINLFNQTVLYWACYTRMTDKASQIIDLMSDDEINKSYINDQTPLFWTCDLILPELSIKLINRMSIDAINKSDNQGRTALYCACYNGINEIIVLLINKMNYESINKHDKYGYTALYVACLNGNINSDLVFKLIDKMSNDAINKTDDQGQTALLWTCIHKQIDISNKLINRMNHNTIYLKDKK